MSRQGENVNKSNVLSLESLKNKHKESFKMVENHVTLDGELLSYKMYEKFPRTLKDEYIKELVEFSYDVSMDEELSDLADSMAVYTLILIIDKFTDLDVPKDKRERILYAGFLSDFGILDTILISFEEEEVTKVMDEAEQVMKSQTERLENLFKEYENDFEEIDEMTALRVVEKDLEEKELKGE